MANPTVNFDPRPADLMPAHPIHSMKREWWPIFRYLPIYVACIGLAGLLWGRPLVLLGIYLALTALLLWRWHTPRDLIYYGVPFILGPAGECFPVIMGAWNYSLAPHHIPIWLPFVWGIAGIFMGRTSKVLEDWLGLGQSNS